MLPVYFFGKQVGTRDIGRSIKVLIVILIVLGGYQAFLGLLQLYGFQTSHHHLFKMTGSFTNPAPFAGFLAGVFPLALSSYFFTGKGGVVKRVIKNCSLGVVLLLLLVIPPSMSRSAWLASLIGAGIVCASYFDFGGILKRYFNKPRRKILLTLLFSSLAILSMVGLYSLKMDSANGRLFIWKISARVVAEQPIFGVGFGRFTSAFGNAQAAYFGDGLGSDAETMVAGKGEFAFNELVNIAVEQGLLGLVLFLGFMISLIRRLPSKNSLQVGFYAGFCSLLVFSLFSYPFSIIPLLLCFYIFAGILSGFNSRIGKSIILFQVPLYFSRLGYILLIGGLTAVGLKLKNQMDALENWKIASSQKYNIAYAATKMEEVYERLSYDGDFLFEYGQVLALSKDYNKAIEILNDASMRTSDPYLYSAIGDSYKAIKMYNEAEKAYRHAHHLIPHKFYPLYLLSKLYDEWGKSEKAVNTAQQLLTKKIKVHSTAIDEMKVEMEEIVKKNFSIESRSH